MTTKIIMTDGEQTKTIFKSLDPFTDETPGVWTTTGEISQQARSTRLVPSVFAGIAARMQAMADLPFTIYDLKGKEVDNSDDYQNKVGFLPYPSRVFALTEGALVVAGRGYWHKDTGTTTGKVKALKYWIPSSVTLDQTLLKDGVILFKRNNENYKPESVLYVWLLDPDVELGPPIVWPLESAMIAAQANGAITKWVADYMKRGAVKAMMLMVEGMPPAGEVERMEGWFNRFMTGARALTWKVFNSAGVKPTIIGEGLDALKDLSVSKEMRYEIHTALGTRHLLEDENFATATARERQFYTITVVPDARTIQYAVNEQILHPMGYHLEFEPERLEIFQEDEGEAAKAFGELFGIFSEVMTPEIAFQLASEKLDYQFTDEQKKLIAKGINEKKQEAEKEPEEPVVPEKEKIPPQTVRALVELDRWEDKVNKAGKMCVWHPVDLSADIVKAIRSGEITFAQAREKVNPSMLFAPAVQDNDIKELAASLNKLAEAMSKESEK